LGDGLKGLKKLKRLKGRARPLGAPPSRMKRKNKFPRGWNKQRVQRVLEHYDPQAKRKDFETFLAASPDVPPLPGDELPKGYKRNTVVRERRAHYGER
jgi:hypothetical protein